MQSKTLIRKGKNIHYGNLNMKSHKENGGKEIYQEHEIK